MQPQLNSAQLTTAQVAAVVAPSTFSSRKRVTFITLPFAYLSWILDQVRPFWSWSLPEGASSSFPWDQEAFQRNWTRIKRRRKRDVLMMMTVVFMFIENLPSIGWVYYSTQLAYCQSFPWNREAFQQFFLVNHKFILHKTEIQTVILRCLMSLNLNWYKSYDKKHKKAKNAKDENVCFCTKSQKKRNGNICVLSHNFWTNLK